jgi:hypothetical protein
MGMGAIQVLSGNDTQLFAHLGEGGNGFVEVMLLVTG